jgi:hypothetical protein
MATSGTPQFSAKGATEWTKLIADLRSAASGGTNQSTAGDKLKERFTRIEIGIKEAPSREVNAELRQLTKTLSSKMASLEGKKDSKENEALRKSLRDDMKLMERSILRTSMTATGTIGRQLLQSQKLKERDAARKFKDDTKENYKEIQATLAKQLLDVTESRGVNDSEQLRRLQGDLAESLRALKSDDFEHYRDLSHRLNDVSKNYGVDESTASRLESIQDLVQDQAQRKEAKHDKIQKRLGYVGLGGLYGKGRSLARGVAKWGGSARTAKNFITNTLSGGHARVRSHAAAVLAQSERVSREQEEATRAQPLSRFAQARQAVQDNFAKRVEARTLSTATATESAKKNATKVVDRPLTNKEAVKAPVISTAASSPISKEPTGDDQAKNQEEGVLLQRQVRALEEISKSTKKKGSTSSGTSGGMGGLGGKLKDLMGGMGGKLGGAAMLLGKLGLVGAAAWAGWSLGGIIYEKYAEQIQDAIEVVMGVVNNSIEFASKGIQWMADFIASPVQKIKEVGGKLKDMWDKSSFAKFFSSPEKIGAEGAQALMAAKDGKAHASGAPAGSAALASVSAKLNSPGSAETASNTNALLQPKADIGNGAAAVGESYAALAMGNSTAGSGRGSINPPMAYEEQPERMAQATPAPSYPISRGAEASKQYDYPGMSSRSMRPYVDQAPAESPTTYPGMSSRAIPFLERARSSAYPETDIVPTPPQVAQPEPAAQQSAGAGSGGESQGATSKGSVSSIPTFSYLDNGFFMMNAGVIG